jgi:hypothetical protein
MTQDYGTRRKERQINNKNSLYRVWLLCQNGDSPIQRRTHYSFINRNNPKKCLDYIMSIHTRIKGVGYGWLIDNQTNELIKVFESPIWREPNPEEIYCFNNNINITSDG